MSRDSSSYNMLACASSRAFTLAPILFFVKATIIDPGRALSVVDSRDALDIPDTTLGAWIALGALITVEVLYFGMILRAWLEYRREQKECKGV